MPGIRGDSVDLVETLPVGKIERDIRLAKEGHAGAFQTLHGNAVILGDVVPEGRIPPRGRRAGNVKTLLDCHGHTVQRWQFTSGDSS